MAVCVAKASTVFVQHVPPAAVETFKQWQRGVTAAAQDRPGYQGTDLYPPADGRGGEWVAVIHFEDDETLQKWLLSPVRTQWIEKLRASVGEFEQKSLTGGFSQWFATLSRNANQSPPGWKMALTVLFGLYPTVMLLSIFVVPHISTMGLAFSMLIGNAISVTVLQWLLMPALTRLLGPWLEPKAGRRHALSIGGLVAIVLLLVGMTAIFRQVTG
jgi:antibiotic biosynthesis monooxygenase (ABM) superfamily enzyme